MSKTGVLFICLGNICRSPMAEGMFCKVVEDGGLAERFFVDSVATGNWHPGVAPDGRAQAACRRRGIDISSQRARQVKPEDFHDFDHILVMDRANLYDILQMAPELHHKKIRLFLSVAPELGHEEVPDPYYGADRGFEDVLDLVEVASRHLLSRIISEEGL